MKAGANADAGVDFGDLFRPVDDRVYALPVLVKGRLRMPPALSRGQLDAAALAAGAGAVNGFSCGDAEVLRQPVYDRDTLRPTGEHQYLLLARVTPQALIEADPLALARDLHDLPCGALIAYVDALRDARAGERGRVMLARAARCAGAAQPLADEVQHGAFAQLAGLLDGEALLAAVDRELAGAEGPGRRYLDGWVEVSAVTHRGANAHAADALWRRDVPAPGAPVLQRRVRAAPTRQLHISAGNSPLLPFLSYLRGLATKSALTVKSPSDAVAVCALLAAVLAEALPDHPLTRHTSLVYWRGGDRALEDALFDERAYDRLVVWGSPDTVRSVRARAPAIKSVYLNPRYGLSLIGREAFAGGADGGGGELTALARRACADSLIANQQACTASLVHYLVASESQALDYCEALRGALADWDRRLPHRPPRALLGRLRMLRRSTLLAGRWFVNGRDPDISSAVVYMPEPFDLSVHPMSRLVVVRRLDRVEQIAPLLNPSVSTLGVYPQAAALAVRDLAAAAGVSNVLPLGECEQVYAGMPHDGMRVLGELVNWVNG